MTSMLEHQPTIEQSNSGPSDKCFDVYREPNNDFKKQIRVLEIHAGAGTEDIRCTLSSICLTEEEPQTKYETISYVWGDKRKRAYLFVNDVHMDAPASSIRVLQRMRLRHKSRVVWIDAICINQTDIEERNQQVEMMGMIYAKAVRNLIWLGEEDCDTAEAIYSIAAISTDIEHEAKDSGGLRNILYPSPPGQGAPNSGGGWGPRISGTGLAVEVDQQALRRFFSSAWFSRLWVCQEAALSPESVCYKGNFESGLKDVLKAALWIRYKQRYLPLTWDACTERAADLADWADRNIGYFRNLYGSTVPPGIALASLLWSLRNFEAGDDRDRIFAVIGLCEAYSQTRTKIVPNYRTDTADAFRTATKFIMEDNGDLRIFRDICRRLDDEDDESTFTTWVCRYDWKRDMVREPYRLITFGQNADGGERMAMSKHNGPAELLILRGLDLDTIRCRTATLRETDTAATILDFLTSVEQLVARTVEDVPQATRSTIAKILRGGRLAADPNVRDDGDLYTEFKRLLVQQAAQSAHGLAKGELVGDEGVAAFRTAFTHTCYARCFFRTESGHLGVGPHTLQVGDAVTIIYGSSLPVILRRSTTHKGEFHLIGVSYVYGIMNGEAVHQHKEHSRNPVEMRIR